MTIILLTLAASLILAFLAGCRYATLKHDQRRNRRGGYINLSRIGERP